jgi:flagellar biosynthetic protein FlhB
VADEEDQSSKTEEPTDRKLTKLREEGNVSQSKEVNNLFMLVAMLVVVAVVLPWHFQKILDIFGTTFQNAGHTRVQDISHVGNVFYTLLVESLWALIPILVVLMVFAYFGGVIQNGPLFSTKPVQPKLEKISMLKGLKRIFSIKALMEFFKSVLKLLVVGGMIWGVFYAHDNDFLVLVDMSLVDILGTTHTVAVRMILAALAVMVLLAVVDWLFQRNQFMKEQRMSRRELKDEVKESEGDPHIKMRQRQIRMERAQRRMMQEVPKSDVVITNPTHFSVALSYKPEEGMVAPIVVAKGVDWLALRIRELADEHNIPRYEDPPLARQLYQDVEIGDEIPLELYEVTAQVIAYVLQLKRRRRA